MRIVDTSVWINHLRRTDHALVQALEAGEVLVHPFVIGELACGSIARRATMLDDLGRLPQAIVATHEEVMHLVTRHSLAGTGIGWIDAHLIASARLSASDLLTHDAALQRAWDRVRMR